MNTSVNIGTTEFLLPRLLDLDKKKKAGYAANGDFTESEELAFIISYS